MNNLIFMEPVYKDYIWGGNRLKEQLNKKTPYERTAESWEISANASGNCKILNEEYKGSTLADLFSDTEIRKEIFGTKCDNMKEFPILIKFIDAKDNLSIQVHPDDEYAQKIGMLNGKNEMWYIIDCEENSQLIGGLSKKLNNEELKYAIDNNEIKNYLNYIEVKKGDCIYIPAGTLHAILRNNFICEIQQNSDTTYRVYDWDRVDKDGVGRKLHKKEASETIKTDIKPEVKHTDNNETLQNIVKNKYFEVYKINCTDNFEDSTNSESFYTMNVVNGNGSIETDFQKINIKIGDSFIIPSTLGRYKISGKIEILRTNIV